MASSIQAIRGMNDILPIDTAVWQTVEAMIRSVLDSYCYQEIRLPILEKTELFNRSIGEATDVVEKEMYTFLDRNEDSLTLRPEGTAGCVRAGLENGLLYNQIQRLWYQGPFFRYERPQKGRYRQFHQVGVEAFGLQGPDIDAEIILLFANLLHKLGLSEKVNLEINSLGSTQSRAAYREKLVSYLETRKDELDADSQRRLLVNPLRILDSKNPAMQELIEAAPKLIDHIDAESKEHFDTLLQILDSAKVAYTINPRLVRGLDYYTKTVFEWVTTELGAQGTVCAGGRYDGLVELLGGKPTPALGFAIGMERLILLESQQINLTEETTADIFIINTDIQSYTTAIKIADELRVHFPAERVMVNCGGGSFKNQFKRADKSGAKIALILGEDEIKNQSVSIKFLREEHAQVSLKEDELITFCKNYF